MEENIQTQVPSAPTPPTHPYISPKKSYLKHIFIFSFVIFLLLVSFYSGMAYDAYLLSIENKKTIIDTNPSEVNTSTESADVTSTNNKMTVSFAKVNGDIYLKNEIFLLDESTAYANDTFGVQTYVYSEDKDLEPTLLKNLNPADYSWKTLITDKIINFKDYKTLMISDRILSFKKVPNSDKNFMFVVDRRRDGAYDINNNFDTIKDERTIYYYDESNSEEKLKTILTLVGDYDTQAYTYPKINSFSTDGRYVSLELFGCWNCGGHQPQILLVDTSSGNTKNIGKVLSFSWGNNGEYQYKEYVVIDRSICEKNNSTTEEIISDTAGECVEKTENVPIKTGRM